MKPPVALRSVIAAIIVLAPAATAANHPYRQAATEPSPQVLKLLEEGSAYFHQQDFKKAIGPYSKALDLEKKHPTLDKTLWRVLVDNLGMSYGISGDLKKAKETFEYGLGKDEVYPMFYYNLACTYAEMGDIDNTIVNLKSAFRYKENMIVGEQMPDAAHDGSFQRFLTDDRFRAALREIGQGGE